MNPFKQAYRFATRDLWRISADDLGLGQRIGYSTLKTLVLSIRGFVTNDINTRANSLTYSFMFAIVPMIAMVVAVARGFGFEQVIENTLNRSFLGPYHIVPTIMGFVQRYLETAQGGLFIGIGILILLWAIYSFFRNVEESFNTIWQVQQSRSIIRQLANYLTLLILIPILLIVSSGASIYLSSTFSSLALLSKMSTLKTAAVRFLPWVTSWGIFCLLYWTVPNTKVGFSAAMVPGILVGTLVQILQLASVYIIVFLGRTSIVYGTFAAVPLLLTWMQWTCILILTGAQLSYAIQNKEHFNYQVDTEVMSRRYKDYLTLYLCYQIIRRFEDGTEAYTASELAKEDHIPVRLVNQLLSRLIETGIISCILSEKVSEASRYQPAMDIHKITVGMVFDHIDRQGTEQFLSHLPAEMDQFWESWLRLKQQTTDYNNLLVKDIL